MSELLAIGVSHKTAAVEVRELLALPEARAQRFLSRLRASCTVDEAVVISTCNRTELYLVVGDPVQAESAVLTLLAEQASIRPTALARSMYVRRNCDAARHLYRVTAGLESMMVGEAEIQGQVKRAFETALSQCSAGPLTKHLFRAALATGKRVRTETSIGERALSLPAVAVALARELLGELVGRRVVIVGTGETSELTARALAECGCAPVFVATRRRARALSLAARYGGESRSFDELPAALHQADIVVTATASPHLLIEERELSEVMDSRCGRALVLIDLAVPRDIEAACGQIPGVSLHDIDDLQAVIARNRRVRQAEARRAEAVIEEEIREFAAWLGSLEIRPTLAALRAHASEIVRAVLAENEGRWETASPRDRERVEALSRAIVNRLLHEPTAQLKAERGERAHQRVALVRELFGLSVPDGGLVVPRLELADGAQAHEPTQGVQGEERRPGQAEVDEQQAGLEAAPLRAMAQRRR
jgi:glutamyl-tRNA reductase